MTTRVNDILVLGATGKTGRRLVPRLRAKGATVRAASRSGEVTFDWTKPATWPAAVQGAGAVYLVAPDDPGPLPEFLSLASKSVRHIVQLSGRGLDAVDGDFAGMATAERLVRDSGADWTVLRANNFNQNFDEDLWQPPLAAGRLALPAGDVPEPFIDADDIADVAALVLTEAGHGGRQYELSGPQTLTFAEATEIIARAAGRPISYVELTPEAYRAELATTGYPPEVIDALDALFAAMRAGHSAQPTDDVRTLLGREGTPFTTYAERAARAGAWG
ncbi:NmrA family transcriptional regulator [Paractinoplanes abujensis]|uniref:Uncharacterized protein YbjT (DUF2867 family) n=1 Tax=Paractinoplanes abujensis TaxID=882441 RepID=A0A7W7G3B1_9ACTN|nr:NAD(P)H-binding protein [Actinoplanes abujensis]MBB4692546.1 uncharacterized protein YbjT (DUF2867 family) [Actinoplanes abujensis]GID22956.1 NmrA family transcriptional regulator [Actinoplanes abujensis]